MKKLIVLWLIFFAFGCERNDQVDEIRIMINHYQQPAFAGEPIVLCYVVQEGNLIGSNEWSIMSPWIEGFNYELGYVYDIKVLKQKIKNPPMDASSFKYTLRQVVSKIKVSDQVRFQIRLSNSYTNGFESFVTGNTNTGFQLLNTTNIDCSVLCEELAKDLNDQKGLTGEFVHENGNIKLLEII